MVKLMFTVDQRYLDGGISTKFLNLVINNIFNFIFQFKEVLQKPELIFQSGYFTPEISDSEETKTDKIKKE